MLTCPHCHHPLVLRSALEPEPEPAPTISPQQLQTGLRQYLDVVRSSDTTSAAVHVFGPDADRDRAQLERVRRGLERLVRDGACTRSTVNLNGWRGGRVTTYTVAG